MTTAQKIIKYVAIAFAIFLTITIITAILSTVNGLAGVLGLRKEKETIASGMNKIQIEDASLINNLDIDIAFSNLKIENANNFEVQTNNSSIECKQYGNKLKIVEKNNKWFYKNTDSELIIYIPENIEFKEVEINTGAGIIEIENIKSQQLKFELGAGETKIHNIDVNNSDIEGGVGKLIIESGKINNLDFDMGVGEANIFAQLTGKNKIDTGIGSLELNIIGNKEDYEFKINKGIGTIKIDETEVIDNEKIGTGVNLIDINGGIGNIKVNFK